MGKQVDELIELLQTSLAESLAALSVLSDVELDEPSDHPCAMGGTLRDLLTHNIDHERMHMGQIYSARYSLRQMQGSELDRLMAETLRARTDLIAALIGLPDSALGAHTPDEKWSIREIIEHTIYWERHSIDDLVEQKLQRRLPADRPRLMVDVSDPINGPLARSLPEEQ